MKIFYSQLHKNLKKGGEYEALVETAYLLQNPAMAKRLLDAVVDVKKGTVSKHGLIDKITKN